MLQGTEKKEKQGMDGGICSLQYINAITADYIGLQRIVSS